MSFQGMAWAYRQRTGDPVAKAVLMALANYCDDEGTSFVSRRRIADEIECDERTVSRALARLSDGDPKKGVVGLRLVQRRRRMDATGRRTTDLYILALRDNLSGDKNAKPEGQIVPPILEPQPKPVNVSLDAHREAIADPLRQVLRSEVADALVDHRKRLGAALTEYTARLLAAKLDTWPDPNAAAERMIENGWKNFDRRWMNGQSSPYAGAKSAANGAGLGKGDGDDGSAAPQVFIDASGDPETYRICSEATGHPPALLHNAGWWFPAEVVAAAKRTAAA